MNKKNMTREEKIEKAKRLLQEEGFDIILKDEPLSDDQLWSLDFLKRYLEAKTNDERKHLIKELNFHNFLNEYDK